MLPAVKPFVWALVKLTAMLAVPPLIDVTCPVVLPIVAVTVPAGTAGTLIDPVGTITNCQLTAKPRVIVGLN